jgi:XTP/dITP diphosphohydrolase
VVVASKNPAKAAELAAILGQTGIQVVGAEILAKLPAPHEDGATFTANARKKAIHYSRYVPFPVIADDSGLCVDALDGQPGVRSARLGGPAATDGDRIRLVLRKLEGVPWEARTARFVCVLAVAQRGVVLATFDGEVEGVIDFEPKGSGGFGYDPVFFYPPAARTFAELEAGEKDRVSHRSQALSRAVGWLAENLRGTPEELPES